MPSLAGVSVAALAAMAFFMGLGLPIARLALPASLARGLAPALGWAVFSAVALPVFSVVPFTAVTVPAFALCCLGASLAALWRFGRGGPDEAAGLPVWAFPLAGVLALLPAMAIMPKQVAAGILLGPPIFDHAKVAIIDQIARQGMPPANPFFGLAGQDAPLAYYYLWHFSAAMLAESLGGSGWSADVAMTWFTAASSLLLMMALAVYIGGARRAAWLVAALSLPAGVRPDLFVVIGKRAANALLPEAADLGGWQNQASWVPQHMESASCVVVSLLLMARLARPDDGWRGAVVLPLVVAAGFESSTWVGGVAFAAACVVVAPLLLAGVKPRERGRFVARAGVAAAVAGVLVAPFVVQQAAATAARAGGAPIALTPYRVFGAWLPAGIRPAADLLAFWPLALPFNLPALFPAGLVGGILVWRRSAGAERRCIVLVLGAAALACLCVTWLFRSTIENNDLGWRAVIPPILVLTVFAAAGASRWLSGGGGRGWMAAALGMAVLGLPQAVIKVGEAAVGQRPGDPQGFARAGGLWDAVRRDTAEGERVGNNPQLLASVTPWADNIGWALLSNRPSCYSGWATSVAYAAIPKDDLIRISNMFTRVFAGNAQPGDIDALARRYDCKAAIVTSADGAWARDPFAASSEYRLIDSRDDYWRIYRRTAVH